MLTVPRGSEIQLNTQHISAKTKRTYIYVIEHVKTSISKSGLWRFWERTSETSRATVGLLAKLVPLKKIAYVPPVLRGAMVGWYLLIPSGKRHTASPSSRACAHGQHLG